MAANSLRSQLSTIPKNPHLCFDFSDKTVTRVHNAVKRKETPVLVLTDNDREIETIHFTYDYINFLLGFIAGKEHKIIISKRLHSDSLSFHDIILLLTIIAGLHEFESGSISFRVAEVV